MSVLIAIATDHRGYDLKEQLKQNSDIRGVPLRWNDLGTFSSERTDYPPFAHQVVQQILSHHVDYGILLCGSGTGMAIAANRFKGIYAAVVWNEKVARQAKEDDGCNVLVIPVDYVTLSQVQTMIHAWLTASFKGGRYAERLAMLDHE